MKNPVLAIKETIKALLGDNFIANGETVQVFADPPQKAPDYFIWSMCVTQTDIGAKDTFITDVDYEITCVDRASNATGDTLTLEYISDAVTEAMVLRGGITSANANFKLLSVVLTDSTDGKMLVQERTESWRKLRLLIKCEQL